MTEENKPNPTATQPATAEPAVVSTETAQPVEATPAVETVEKLPEIKPGATIRVHQKIRETNAKGEEKERIQVYEGLVIAVRHGQEAGATMTVRKTSDGIGVEKIFPLHSPNIAKVELVKQAQVRRAKLYFLRDWKRRLKETFLK